MHTLQWRSRARVVAFADVGLTSFTLLFVIWVAAFPGGFTFLVYSDADSDPRTVDSFMRHYLVKYSWISWCLVGLTGGFTILKLWTSIKLANSTEIGRNFTDGLRATSFWCNVTVVFLIFKVFGSVLMEAYFILLIEISIRGAFLYVVHKFMEELDKCRNPILGSEVATKSKS